MAKVGKAVIRIVDCTVDPFTSDENWKVVHHDTSLGNLNLDMVKSKFGLYYRDENQSQYCIRGSKIPSDLQKLKNRTFPNANVLDAFLADTNMIPENVRVACQERGEVVYFWNTIYLMGSFHEGVLVVRSLTYDDGQWSDSFDWTGRSWGSNGPALVLPSIYERY